jgi:ADP-heptose:LPS heptosyltransferase
VVTWGPGERDRAEAVVAASRGQAVASPPTALHDVLALARVARLCVSGDTGPLHLAASVGTPIVGLFGPTRPERNGPWAPADESVSRAAECVCFHKRRCLRGRACIERIEVLEVLDACTRRLARIEAAS